jgi:hypothetical protein
VPAKVRILRFRIMTSRHKVLLTVFASVKAGSKLKLNLHSGVLRSKLVPGKRYVLEVTPGTSKTALGTASLTTFLVRR